MVKPDGRLTDDPDRQDQPPRDACGVFGVWSPGEEVAKLAYFGLYALQHRGQESAGIAVSDGTRIVVYKDMGLVAQVFDESVLSTLRGHIAVGHCRYSTSGSSVWENAQPTFRSTPSGSLALGHNGNLINTLELAAMVEGAVEAWRGPVGTSDTDVLTALFADPRAASVADAALAALPLVKGAFSLVFMDEQTLYAARDPQGFRPLVLGRLEQGWAVASETAALDIVGAAFVREVEPGELIMIDESGVSSAIFAPARPRGCLFEYVYLARPDTTIAGRSVQAARVEVGRRLAAEHPAAADLVIPVPESGTPAAIGYAQASGIPYGQGLVKNSYVGRTFIQPSQTIRQRGIRLKLNPLRERDRRAAGGRGGRFDRARQHPAGDRRHAARGGRRAGPCAHLQPAGELALLLRDRLRHPGRADRGQPVGGGDPGVDRGRLAGLHLAHRADRGDHAARGQPVPCLLRR